MAFKTGYEISCSCGARFTGELYEYIFTEYDPELRDALLTGEFNWVTCPSCSESLYIQNRFLYRDEKNKLWIWVCRNDEKSRKEELSKELMEDKSHFKDHFLDHKDQYRKYLVFGREALIELLLKEDRDLKRTEGKYLKKNKALRLIPEENLEPGLFLLRGEKVRVAMPLKSPAKPGDSLDDPEAKKRWLKFYSQGLNIHNPYSSFLGSRMKTRWNKIREKEPCRGPDNEFDDFAQSWTSYKMDPKGFRIHCPERWRFFQDIKNVNITRKVQSINLERIMEKGRENGHGDTVTQRRVVKHGAGRRKGGIQNPGPKPETRK